MEYNKENSKTDHITIPFIPKEELVKGLVKKAFNK
jgi:urocanate hydratase